VTRHRCDNLKEKEEANQMSERGKSPGLKKMSKGTVTLHIVGKQDRRKHSLAEFEVLRGGGQKDAEARTGRRASGGGGR